MAYVVIGIVVIGVSMCVGILLYNVFTPLTSITKYYVFRKLFLILILLGLHAILFPYAKTYCNSDIAILKGSGCKVLRSFLGIVVCSALMTSMVSFLVVPTEIYNSDPKEIAKPLLDIQKPLFVMAVVWILGMMTAYGITPRRYKLYITGIASTISVVVFSYAYVLPFDYGKIDRFRLMNPQVINATIVQYFFEGVGLTLLFLLVLRILRSQPKTLFVVLSLGLVFVTIKFVIAERYYLTRSSVVSDTITSQDTGNTQAKDSIKNELLSFSKDGRNIVVLLLDMFNGGLMQTALREHPNLETSYDGFVWYPNSLSISTYTTTSKPSMMAGWRYTPANITTVLGDNLAERVESAYNEMFDLYQKQNYHVATSGVSYYGGDNAQCETLEKRNIACLGYWDRSFIAYWQSMHPLSLL